jgi:hypothetical protein
MQSQTCIVEMVLYTDGSAFNIAHLPSERNSTMSADLTVASAISKNPQPVQTQASAENSSALFLASEMVQVLGQDVVGDSMPLWVQGSTSLGSYQAGTTWGRLIRVVDVGTSGAFYDIGIDQWGNLFINSPRSSESQHVLTLSTDGTLRVNVLAIDQLQLTGLTSPPPGVSTVDVVIDPQTGKLYRQS